jgi:hypothetical protein
MKEYIATNYAVVYSPSIEKLVTDVQKLIADGWKPQGGVASSDTGLYQAMVRLTETQFHSFSTSI